VQLLTEVIRLREVARSARLESANRLAAMLAALHAARDGETDPLAATGRSQVAAVYLRDELAGHEGREIPDTGRGWCA
jgi:hypothetical protein